MHARWNLKLSFLAYDAWSNIASDMRSSSVLSVHQGFADIRAFLRNLTSPFHLTLTKTLLHKTAAPRRSSQGQIAAGPLAPRQLAARPASGERRYSQPAEPRPAPRPGMGLEGGQQGGPTAEQRCLLIMCPLHVTLCTAGYMLLPKAFMCKHKDDEQLPTLLLQLLMILYMQSTNTTRNH